MMPRLIRAAATLLGALAMCLLSARAHAMSCTIINTSSVRFGSYDVFDNQPLDSTGTVEFRCTQVAAGDMLSIQLNRGESNTFLPRAMMHHGMRFEYNLYLDAARSVVWGDGTSGTSAYTVRPIEGQTTSVPIYGRITPRQNVAIGSYSDSIVLTVLY
jgi:spore coat protein U-like protein